MNFDVLFLWKNTCFMELADGRTFTLLDSALHGGDGQGQLELAQRLPSVSSLS